MKLFLNTWFEGQASEEWSGLEMVLGAGEQRQCLWERGSSVLLWYPIFTCLCCGTEDSTSP